jgi:hypothetical protein
MNITVTIAGLEPLAAAISNLASAIGDRPLPSAPAETKAPAAKTAADKPASKSTKASESSASTTSEKPSTPVVDAGTGQVIEPEAGALSRDEVKLLATQLTQKPGGNAALKELFTKHGATEMKFSAVPDETLGAFAADVQAALAAD